MGTGGTGDVLTGMLAGLTAQYGTTDWHRLLSFGVYLHGLAGDIAYAETGDFEEAIRWQQSAVDNPQYLSNDAARRRLEAYRQKLPHRLDMAAN